jgi:glycosyltransferase involved in cell wall biosynthesis
MKAVLFECERMKHPHTGLYHFCLNLGSQIVIASQREKINFLVPKKLVGIFGDNANYVPLQAWNKIHIGNQYRWLATRTYDVWHMTYQTSYYKPTSSKTRLVMTLHDLNFLHEHPDNLRKANKYLKIVQDRIDRADHVVFISKFCKHDAEQHLNFSNKTTSIIYNGCTFFPESAITPVKVIPNKPFIFSIGTILPKKNFHVLPRLLVNTNFELVIAGIGNPDYQIKIQNEARRLGVYDRLKLLGAVSENDKNWYYKNCLAFAFPSIAEGFGLPVIEAMSYGKPVFLSLLTSLPEIGGPHAYYFENFEPDTMQRVFQQGMEHFNKSNSSKEIKKWAQNFSWEKAAQEYLAVYQSLY